MLEVIESKPRHIVSFSGGKDSTAMLLLLLEKGYPIDEIRAFDGGWEFPQMYEHWAKVEEYTGMKINVVKYKWSFTYMLLEREMYDKDGKVYRIGMGWPNPFRRWCTGRKLETLYKGKIKGDVWYVGLAFDERHRIANKSSEAKGIIKQYPLIEWEVTERDALDYCLKHGFDWGGLYDHFNRVSCFCCPIQPLNCLRKLRKYYPNLWEQMLIWDSMISDNQGFKMTLTVRDLERRFVNEEKQPKLFDML